MALMAGNWAQTMCHSGIFFLYLSFVLTFLFICRFIIFFTTKVDSSSSSRARDKLCLKPLVFCIIIYVVSYIQIKMYLNLIVKNYIS